MKTLTPLSVLLFLFPFTLHASVVKLPQGGKVNVDSQWTAQSVELVKNSGTMMFANLKEKELVGYLMDGAITTTGQCTKVKGSKKGWSICRRSSKVGAKISEQVVLQRKLSESAVQNYTIVFNFPETKKNSYLPIINAFEKQLGVGL